MRFFYRDIELEIPESVYEPREDSLLLAKALEEKLKGGKIKTVLESSKELVQQPKVLEIGCGSGLLSIIAAKRGCEVLAADIDSAAVECTKRNAELNGVRIEAVQSDLFHNVIGKFGLIIFNPPYLPEEQNKENRAWAGGKNLEIISEFIKQVKNYLADNGKILVVISSFSNPEAVLNRFSDNGFKAKIVAEQKIPWEKLFVICAKIR